MPQPVILLAFANNRENEVQYLRNLPFELNELRRTLSRAEDQHLCELVLLPNATLEGIIATFQREKYRNRIAIFHYGGHAGSYELLLERADGSPQTAHAAGLVPFLASQRGLQLVFLNGCSSARQAERLVESGVPAVVGTVTAVADDVATALAAFFYRALAEGAPLGQAWQEATFHMKAQEGIKQLHRYYHPIEKKTQARDVLLEMNNEGSFGHFPWQIYCREGAEAVRQWNLPAAAEDPYFGLPAIPDRYSYPEDPHRFLERYHRSHAHIFFGRGQYIRDLYFRLLSPHSAPALLLYGQSGVGKSSLLEAGLLPRLESEYDVHLARRDPEIGLAAHLAAALGLPHSEVGSATLCQQWRHLESQSDKKGLLIILDQVEEVFTRPHKLQADELAAFLRIAAGLFRNVEERPRGKLLLSYRKEYDPEIDKACREAGLPKEKIFVDKLDRAGICEIAGGLASTQALRNKYRLEVEKGLALLADDLLEDKNSAVAPVLQIILTKLWKQEEPKDKRLFSCEDYQKLKREGILLDDFFHQQMATLRAWEQDFGQPVESSGLALDLLNHHTTSLGTAQSRNLEDLRRLYQHQADLLQALVPRLQSIYLLTGLGPESSALAHDTLAPIVQREIRNSDKPGQRALRILLAKAADFELNPGRTFIDEEDLRAIEEGVGGMRLWTAKEKELIERSRKRREQLEKERLRNRRLKNMGVITITLLALVASLFGFRSYQQSMEAQKQAKVSQMVSEALQKKESDPTQAFQMVNEAVELAPENKYALEVRRGIYEENEFYQLAMQHPASLKSVAIAGDGAYWVSAGEQKIVRWNTEGQPIDSFLTGQNIYKAALSPRGTQLLIGARERNTALLLDMQSGRSRSLTGMTDWAISVAFSEDGRQVVTGGRNGEVILWESESGAIVQKWHLHKDIVRDVYFSRNQGLLVSGGDDLMVYLMDIGAGAVRSFVHPTPVYAVAVGPEGSSVLTGGGDGILRIWDIEGRFSKEIAAHTSDINEIAFHPDGNRFLTTGNDQTIKLWNQDGVLQKTYKGHPDGVQDVAFVPNGAAFISGSEDGALRYWPTDSKGEKRIEHPGRVVYKVTFAADGHFATAIGNELYELDEYSLSDEAYNRIQYEAGPQPVLIWDAKGRPLRELSGHEGYVSALAISNGLPYQYLSGGEDAKVLLWNQAGELSRQFTSHTREVNALAFAPGDTTFASAGSDSIVCLQHITGAVKHVLSHEGLVSSLAFSPDGQLLLTGCYDGRARIWNTASGKLLSEVSVGDSRIESVAFSKDNIIALGASTPAMLRVLQLEGEKNTLLFERTINAEGKTGKRSVNSIAFSPDGRRLLIGAHGNLVALYNLDGEPVQEIRTFNEANVYSVAFSPDGKWLLAGSGDSYARLLKLALTH